MKRSISTMLRGAIPGSLAATVLAMGLAGPAEAKDAVRAQVEDAGGGIVTENGAFHVP